VNRVSPPKTERALSSPTVSFEHNYGHGQHNLSVVFAALMMLAFLVDQVQQLADALFQAVLKKKKRLIRLWEHLRALFQTLAFKSMEELFHAILYGYTAQIKLGTPP
jgi:hypothetical protein